MVNWGLTPFHHRSGGAHDVGRDHAAQLLEARHLLGREPPALDQALHRGHLRPREALDGLHGGEAQLGVGRRPRLAAAGEFVDPALADGRERPAVQVLQAGGGQQRGRLRDEQEGDYFVTVTVTLSPPVSAPSSASARST